MLVWAHSLGEQRHRAIEDCRHQSRRLERDLLAAGEQIVRVPPKVMAGAHTAAYAYALTWLWGLSRRGLLPAVQAAGR
jgi:hypothetical protein